MNKVQQRTISNSQRRKTVKTDLMTALKLSDMQVKCYLCKDEAKNPVLCKEGRKCDVKFHSSCLRAWTERKTCCPRCDMIIPGAKPTWILGASSITDLKTADTSEVNFGSDDSPKNAGTTNQTNKVGIVN